MSRSFLRRYLLWLAFLFGVLYWDLSPLGRILDHGQRALTLKLLELGFAPGVLQGTHIVVNPHYHIVVTQACNGLIPYFIYLAALLAYPRASVGRKIVWSIVGYSVFTVVNVLRLWMVFYLVAGKRENFFWAHDLLGNALLMVVGLGLFYLFLRRKRNGSDSVSNAVVA